MPRRDSAAALLWVSLLGGGRGRPRRVPGGGARGGAAVHFSSCAGRVRMAVRLEGVGGKVTRGASVPRVLQPVGASSARTLSEEGSVVLARRPPVGVAGSAVLPRARWRFRVAGRRAGRPGVLAV